jgi:hypothetical protein
MYGELGYAAAYVHLFYVLYCVERYVEFSKHLLEDLKKRRGYWNFKQNTLDGTLWRTGFGRVCGPVVRQTTELNKYNKIQYQRKCTLF